VPYFYCSIGLFGMRGKLSFETSDPACVNQSIGAGWKAEDIFATLKALKILLNDWGRGQTNIDQRSIFVNPRPACRSDRCRSRRQKDSTSVFFYGRRSQTPFG
jgi:hypothetical protein